MPSDGSDYAQSSDTVEYVVELSDDSDVTVSDTDEKVDDPSKTGRSDKP